MSYSLRFALLACLIVLPATIYAGILKGKVTDTKGGELPFASVFVQGTTNGTTANADGEYQLSLPDGNYKVTCQYMGFKAATFNVTFTTGQTVTHNFSLQDESLKMKDVVIKANAEDPAYAIIRKTIKRRKFHLDQVRSFQSSIYLKGVFRLRDLPKSFMGEKIEPGDMGSDSGGRGVLYLCEEDADYYSRGEKRRTIIKAVHESGNPNGLGLATLPPIVTFYENNVNIIKEASPRGFVSPISDNAIYYYKFKYEGEIRENGRVIDKIKVTPRRKYEPLFTGTVYIVEDDWALQSLSLTATATANLEILDTLRIEQSQLPLKKDVWVAHSQVLYLTVRLLGFDATGHYVTVYNQQKVNEPIPDSLFDERIRSSYEANANKKDTSYWVNRPVPLETDESKDFVVKDSMRKKNEDPAYLDSMRRKYNKFRPGSLIMNGYTYTTYKNKSTFTTNSLVKGLINFNSVEGISLTPKVHWVRKIDTAKFLTGKAAVRYGFSNMHFNAIGKVAYVQNNRKWIGRQWSIGVEGGKYVFQLNGESTLTPFYNTLTTLIGGYNYMKLYERWNGALFFNRNYGNGLSINAKLDYQSRTPLVNTTDFTFGNKDHLTDNLPATLAGRPWGKNDAAIVKLGISYQPGYTYIQYPDFKSPRASSAPIFTLQYQKGIPNIINSVSDFDKWKFSIEDEMGLNLLGSLSYKIIAGGFLNKKNVSIPDMMHLDGNQFILATPFVSSFQLAPYYKYSNTEDLYGELHLEYNMKGLLTNKIPLLRQARWYFVAGTNSFYANTNNYYVEAFGGIANLGYKSVRLLRVDFVYSWNSLNQNSYGIRLGFDPTGIIKINLRNNEEW